MQKITTFTSRAVLLLLDDVDTDQIIPARYLMTTGKEGLGQGLFAGWRYRQDGTLDPAFVLNHPQVEGARILVAGDNFGCGSSREHAPWALMGWGLLAVVATSFADIFRSNSLKNGLLPVELESVVHREIAQAVQQDPQVPLTIDLESQTITLPDGPAASFPIDPFSKRCLLKGFDPLDYLLSHSEDITTYEAAHDCG